MRIGLTDNQKPSFEQYISWLLRKDISLDIAKLSYFNDNLHELDRCDGLVLTGGGDVHPGLYKQPDDVVQTRGVDVHRDDFELQIIERAMKLQLPVLGICRGLQMANVAFGGSLIADLESRGFARHRPVGNEECRHFIDLVPGTALSDIIGGTSGEVNSSHHQGADSIGTGLKVSAKSPDGVVEGLEWADPDGKPFLLLVQWHPERMQDFENHCSGDVLEKFLSEIRKSVQTNNR